MSNRYPVVHFEMPYENAERVKTFYEKAFGWEMKQFGEEMGNYITAHTAETDENNMIQTTGAINGGLFPKKSDSPDQIPSVVVGADDIQEAMRKVVEAGGKVLGEPVEIPGIGLYVSFQDTEGNRSSLLQSMR
ncbi:MAG: VOC family protein [Candidatus Moraniibacteriota bacterium]